MAKINGSHALFICDSIWMLYLDGNCLISRKNFNFLQRSKAKKKQRKKVERANQVYLFKREINKSKGARKARNFLAAPHSSTTSRKWPTISLSLDECLASLRNVIASRRFLSQRRMSRATVHWSRHLHRPPGLIALRPQHWFLFPPAFSWKDDSISRKNICCEAEAEMRKLFSSPKWNGLQVEMRF